MKTYKLKVGVSDRYDKTYMDGRCEICVPVLTGPSKAMVLKAEKIRFDKLNEIAGIMHRNYTACSRRVLHDLFGRYHVTTLRELIQQQIVEFYFEMLTMQTAEEILSANERHLI